MPTFYFSFCQKTKYNQQKITTISKNQLFGGEGGHNGQIKECLTKVKQVFLLYHWNRLVTLELISLIPLVGTPETDPLAVKLLDNLLYVYYTCVKHW